MNYKEKCIMELLELKNKEERVCEEAVRRYIKKDSEPKIEITIVIK